MDVRSQHQTQLAGLRDFFNAVPKLSLQVICFEYELGKFNPDEPNLLPYDLEGLVSGRQKLADANRRPTKCLRQTYYRYLDTDNEKKREVGVKLEAAAKMACEFIRRDWSAGYGISEFTFQSRPSKSCWINLLFDLLKAPRHEAYRQANRFDWATAVWSSGRAGEIHFDLGAKKNQAARRPTKEERLELDTFGIHAKIEDVALASIQAIDRLTNYTADGRSFEDADSLDDVIREFNPDGREAMVESTEDHLKGQSLRIFQFLRLRKHATSYRSLSDEIWEGKPISDKGIKTAIERLQKALNQMDPVYFSINNEFLARRVRVESLAPGPNPTLK